MKLNFKLFIFFIPFLSLKLNAQAHDVQITFSDENTSNGLTENSFNTLFSINDKSVFCYSKKDIFASKEKIIVLDKNSLKETSYSPFFSNSFPDIKNPNFSDVKGFKFGNNTYISYLLKKPKTKYFIRYVQVFGNDNLAAPPQELYSLTDIEKDDFIITKENTICFYTYRNKINTNTIQSRPFTSQTIYKYFFYDINFNEIAKIDAPKLLTNDLILFYQTASDNTINYFIIEQNKVNTTNIDKSNSRNFTKFSYYFLHYSSENKDSLKLDIDLGKYYLNSIKYIIRDKIIYYGGVFNKTEKGKVAGSFAGKFSLETGEQISFDIKNYDDVFTDQLYKNTIDEKSTNIPTEHFKFHDIYINDDGSYYIIGEYAYWVIGNDFNNNAYIKNYNNDIIIIKVNNDGDIEFTTNIPRRSISYLGLSYSYSYIKINNDLVFIYFDHKANLNSDNSDLQSIDYVNKKEDIELITTTMFPDGSYEKKSIIDYEFSKNKVIKPFLNSNNLYDDNSIYTIGVIEDLKDYKNYKIVLVNFKIDWKTIFIKIDRYGKN